MAIIHMGDEQKPGAKKWVAKDTIHRVVAIKDKQVEAANKVARDLHAECLVRRRYVAAAEKELRHQTHLRNVFMLTTVVLALIIVLLLVMGDFSG
jgi:hypothetical protein